MIGKNHGNECIRSTEFICIMAIIMHTEFDFSHSFSVMRDEINCRSVTLTPLINIKGHRISWLICIIAVAPHKAVIARQTLAIIVRHQPAATGWILPNNSPCRKFMNFGCQRMLTLSLQ